AASGHRDGSASFTSRAASVAERVRSCGQIPFRPGFQLLSAHVAAWGPETGREVRSPPSGEKENHHHVCSPAGRRPPSLRRCLLEPLRPRVLERVRRRLLEPVGRRLLEPLRRRLLEPLRRRLLELRTKSLIPAPACTCLTLVWGVGTG